jgi:hypothetical protein
VPTEPDGKAVREVPEEERGQRRSSKTAEEHATGTEQAAQNRDEDPPA